MLGNGEAILLQALPQLEPYKRLNFVILVWWTDHFCVTNNVVPEDKGIFWYQVFARLA